MRNRRGDVHQLLMRQDNREERPPEFGGFRDFLRDVFQKDHFRQRFALEFGKELPAGENVCHFRFPDRIAQRFIGDREVQRRGNFVGDQHGEQRNRACDRVRQENSDVFRFGGNQAAYDARKHKRSDKRLECGKFFAAEVFHDDAERVSFRVFGELVVDCAFLGSRLQFRFRTQSADLLTELEGGERFRHRGADCHACRTGDLFRNAEFDFSVVETEDAAPEHAETDGDHRDVKFFREHS